MNLIEFPRIRFFKLQGSGNDFVIILKDGLNLSFEDMSQWAKKICRRCFGAGADGLIFVERDSKFSYRWHFYNSDGSRAEMCGNGARCVAWLCYCLGIAGREHEFLTDAGPVKAKVFLEEDMVEVQLSAPKNLKLDFELEVSGRIFKASYVEVGVPHVVIFVSELDKMDVKTLGREIRFHSLFSPAGSNVNFVELKGRELYIRTYERGVEDETYACGTGASASMYVANRLGMCGLEEVGVVTSSGEKLFVSLRDGFLFLKGKVTFVYEGELNLKGVGLW